MLFARPLLAPRVHAAADGAQIFAMAEEEDFTKLPIKERVAHKVSSALA